MTRSISIRALLLALVMVLASLGGLGPTSTAEAATFSNSYNGQDSYVGSGSTTLKYNNGHASFNLKIWVVAAKASTSGVGRSDINASYSITMYNASGKVVWSASAQRTRTYYVGSNVTKIIITPSKPYVGAAVNWNKV